MKQHKIRAAWKDLNRTIYVGDRLKENITALTAVSLFTTALGLVLIVFDILTQQTAMLIPSAATFLGGASCAYIAGVLKKRDVAILIPTFFCAIAFTYYTLTGAASGTAILWTFLLPIGLCYFVSVKYGILLSIYYTILFVVVFYTPLQNKMAAFYSRTFMIRIPLLYASLAGFTAIAMVQYHRSILLQNEYTERLNAEVARQTAVAEERSRKIEQMSLQTIQSLAHAIDAKDPYTRGHSTRVSQYSVLVAEKLGWNQDRINDLRYAALLHDIGKIGVPDSILNKPQRLTDVEYDIIKSHTTMGAEILKNRIMIEMAEDVARSHHERYDGRGYPQGLKGTECSEEARIVAIADAFDAMNSNRIYRKACKNDYIRHELIEGRGKQFDPDFTDIFIGLWDNGLLPNDAEKEAETEKENENMEASSALLQEVIKTFIAQNAAENTDLTTGIMSRFSGETAIARSMQEESGCFVFFDVDNLKTINDINGHHAGDKALSLMGETLRENSGDSLCCRLGGDEFLLFMKNISREDAEARIQKILGDYNLKTKDDAEISMVSLSAGAAMCVPADTYTKVYTSADKALYHVKQNGKNGYSFYNSESEATGHEKVDVARLVNGIRSNGSYKGAMDVDYRQFTKLFEYITNLEKRFDCPFTLIMIELDTTTGEEPQMEELEEAMYYLDRAIRQTIRNVDVVTRYSRQQHLVILLGTDGEGVKTVVERIYRGYFKMKGSGAFSPSYSVISK